MVMEVVHEDMGEGNMQCTNHPYKNSTPGGICAFCLQEKLGKLVSSSLPVAIFPSSSSSSSSRSDFGGSNATSGGGDASSGGGGALQPRHLAPPSSVNAQNASGECNYHGYYSRRSKLPFVLTQRRKKKKDGGAAMGGSDSSNIVFKRSKSTATPRRGMHFLDENYSEDYSPHRRGFWSFIYMSKHSSSSAKKSDKSLKDLNFASATASSSVSSTVGSSSLNNNGSGGGGIRSREKKREDFVVVDENGSPDQAAFERKVSRSRSVGCGSRSFSGDFFERISTGFGDCALRRVESQREGKPKAQAGVHRNSGVNGQDCIKERVRCGGIFGGFMITSSSSSSSSSSYWISSSAEDSNGNSKVISSAHSSARQLSHGRSKSWGWALASPMRAFGKPSSIKRDSGSNSNKNVTPNLAAIPSLLAMSG